LRIRRLSIAAWAALATFGFAVQACAADKLGQPTDGGIDFQPAATVLRQRVITFHYFLLVILTAITLLVLGLLPVGLLARKRRRSA